MKKLNFWKILLIILSIEIFLVFVFGLIKSGLEIYNNYGEGNLIVMIMFGILASIFQTILAVFLNPIVFFFGCIYVASKVSSKKVRKTKLSSNDINDYNGYFRDILKEYSVSVLSYIDDFKLDYPSDLIAMLLQMEYKKIISFNEDNITINNYGKEIKPSEKVILDSIKNGKLEWFGYNELEHITKENISEKPTLTITPAKYLFEKSIKEEGLSCGLLEEKEASNKLLIKEVVFSTIIYAIAGFFLFSLINYFTSLNEINFEILYFIPLIILCLFMMFFPFYKLWSLIILYAKVKSDNYFRTKKGEEVNKKLEGLKNFLKDFSILSEREKHEIALWDEYLIYSVLFNHNNAITDKYKKLIK